MYCIYLPHESHLLILADQGGRRNGSLQGRFQRFRATDTEMQVFPKRCLQVRSGSHKMITYEVARLPPLNLTTEFLHRFRSGKIVMQTSAVTPPTSASPAAADALLTMEHARTYLFEGLLQKGAG